MTQELVRATGWRFESSLPHQRHRARKDGLSFTFALSLLPLPGEPGGAPQCDGSATLPGNEDSLTAALTLRQRSMRRGGFRLSPKLSVWGILGSTWPRASSHFYAGAITPGSRAVCVHAVGGMRGGALRVSMQHDSAVDAGHRECARSMAITSAFRALASGVLCEMLRGMALVEALGLRTKKPRRDLSDVMNSVSLGD